MITEVDKKKSDQAIEKLNKKKGESTIVVESAVEDQVTARYKRAGGKDVCRPKVKVDGPMLVPVLEHGANRDLSKGE